jgi:hypothetical protein
MTLVKAFYLGSSSMNLSFFSLFSKDSLQKGINVPEEDVFYNWMDMSSMSMSNTGKPF